MVAPRFRDDPVVDALRWIMVAVMFAGGVFTLAGQPVAAHPINPAYRFFLAHGTFAFGVCIAAYVASAFLLAAVLPRNLALIFILTAILCHVYGGTHWLTIRWQLGGLGVTLYGVGVGFPLALAFSSAPEPSEVARRLALVTALALLVDMGFTLIGQPASYWSHPEMAQEGNPLSRYFLMHGWASFALFALTYAYLLHRAVALLPRLAGLMVASGYILAGFDGAGNWLFFVWHRGLVAIFAYAAVVSTAIVLIALRHRPPNDQSSISGMEQAGLENLPKDSSGRPPPCSAAAASINSSNTLR